MKLLRPLAGYALYDHKTNDSLYDHKTNDSLRRELQTDCILDKIDEYRRNWLLHLQRMPQNRIHLKPYPTAHKEREQLGDQRNDGESNCNSRDGTGQMVQPWMFMMMMMIMIINGIMEHSLGKTLLECSTDGFVHSKTQLLLAAQ
jgi:hypothetical protein